MAADKPIELWKAVVTLGGLLSASGVSILLASASHRPSGHLEFYGIALLVGGLTLALLGLGYAFWQHYEWRRRPTLSRGLSCSHYPTRHEPQLPDYPYFQELAVSVNRLIPRPDFRIFCSARVGKVEGTIFTNPPENPPRTLACYHSFIDAVSIIFSPEQPVNPHAMVYLRVFSDEPIRVRKIKVLKPKTTVPPPAAPPDSRAS